MVHPAHVHFYKHLIWDFNSSGSTTLVASRQKDGTVDLLDDLQIPHFVASSAPRRRRLLIYEMLVRVANLWIACRKFQPDVILSRNPSGVLAGRLLGISSIFDTDDGSKAGIHFWLARWSATAITSPDCLSERYGKRHFVYPSYKALAFLHPNRFDPDPLIADRLGVGSADYSMVRFVAMGASHDGGESGLDEETKKAIVDILRSHGPTFLSSEGELTPDLAQLAFPLGQSDFHSALAGASLYIGDSQSVAAEAALLGVPTIHVSSWAGRLDYLRDLSDRGLMESLAPRPAELVVSKLLALTNKSDRRVKAQEKRQRLLGEKVDLAAWYIQFVHEVVHRLRSHV